MKNSLIARVSGLLALASASLLAHHALINYDTSTPVRVTGTVVEFHAINPHSILYVEQKENGQPRRYAIEGPSVVQLTRASIPKDFFKRGDSIEVCGYLPKEPIVWQVADLSGTNPAAQTVSGRLMNAEVITLPDGTQRPWGDYGFHQCFPPGYTDQHSKK